MNSTNDNRLGARVRELRKGKGWSQHELARRTGTNRNAVCRDENKGPIGITRVHKYAAAFGISPAFLILDALDEP